MTDELVADITATIAAAETLIGTTSSADACTDLAAYLRNQQLVSPLPELDADQAAMVCVDGAVASEQTDALAWIAAVATDSTSRVMRRKTMVVPVSSIMDQVRSAVMALCEMSAAVELYDAGIDAWMDGGLVTPLLSVATAVQSADQQTATALCDLMDAVDAAEIIDGYIDHATQGSMSALPKQDTANSFCLSWSGAAELDEQTRAWLPRRRDRIVAASVLEPGQFLVPRRGVEALRVAAKAPRSGHRRATAWARVLEDLMADWRELVHPWVTYAVPAGSTLGRAVKIELTAAATASDSDVLELAGLRAGQACAGLTGSRVIEPYQQYVVDHLAKTEVRGLLSRLVGQAQSVLMRDHPGAVSHFRS
ncbi:MAG: hypothetical protein DI630_13450 [Gordonia sp. (in: high G+C Gram-positive bacteria)]|nr:MAG: hypothetical protein DI630_13450 [Gordonia sp. (in: high G+C Gram-positive bacteria)]